MSCNHLDKYNGCLQCEVDRLQKQIDLQHHAIAGLSKVMIEMTGALAALQKLLMADGNMEVRRAG